MILNGLRLNKKNLRNMNWIVEYQAKSWKKKLKKPYNCSKIAKKSLFFPLFGKESFLNRTLGPKKSFLNQTTSVLKNRLHQQSFLNRYSFLNRECTVVDRSTALNFTVLSFLPYTKTKTKGLFLVLVVKIQNITTSCWMFRIIHIAFLPERHLYKSWKMIASAIVLLLIFLSLMAETFRQELLKPKYPRYPLLKKGYMLTDKF